MTLIRWNPVREPASVPGDILSMQREINRLFDGFFRGGDQDEGFAPAAWAPAVDIAETEGSYIVRMELPGVTKKDVGITLRENVLTVSGEKRLESETGDAGLLRSERSYGSFQRSFALPSGVQADRIEAGFTDGILTVTLPKSEEAKPRRIDVKVR